MSSRIAVTRPTVTPALRTGARGFEAADVVESRLQRVALALCLKLARLAAFNAMKVMAEMPNSTNSPTSVSRLSCSSPTTSRANHGVENISAVRMKSMPSTASDDTTTVRVVA